ncbi:hypothetical protein RBA00_20570, partial [Mycobacteroides abscessus subsp. massiliense]
MAQLNVNEAQRKAMARELCVQSDCFSYDDALVVVDYQVAAANSIPEGPPVGTIARRPDGKVLAVRIRVDEGFWRRDIWYYIAPQDPEILADEPIDDYDADSWPVIYDPTGKTLDELHAEIDRLDKAEDSALRERDQFKPVKRIDPTAQQEPQVEGNLSEIPKSSTQQEPEECPCAPGSGHCVTTAVPKPPRAPRVVDRLGVDEQGSRWRNRCGEVHEFRDGCWKYNDGGRWFPSSLSFPEYTEIVGPRVLPSLDCEEARDGTVWRGRNGWRFWFNGEWRTDNIQGGLFLRSP